MKYNPGFNLYWIKFYCPETRTSPMNSIPNNIDMAQTYNLQQNLMNKAPNFNMLNTPNISSSMSSRTTMDQINSETSYYQNGFQPSMDKTMGNNFLPQQTSTLIIYLSGNLHEIFNSVCPPYNRNLNYYQEFWRMYLQNEVTITKLKELSQQNKETQNHISALEVPRQICSEINFARPSAKSLSRVYSIIAKKKSKRRIDALLTRLRKLSR